MVLTIATTVTDGSVKANSTADTSEIERKIDEAVYALYGLSEEEIQAVEKAGR